MINILIAFLILQTTPTPTPTPSANIELFDTSDIQDVIDVNDVSIDAVNPNINTNLIGLSLGYIKYLATNSDEIFGVFSILITHVFIYFSMAVVWFGIYATIQLVVVVIRFVSWIIRWLPFV